VTDALVIGAGPAGLMAADVLSAGGFRVTLADAMPSPGRKFLMAGKSGLNLTKDEDPEAFRAAFGARSPAFEAALRHMPPFAVMDWARTLGQTVFTGSTGRVFPHVMKASPLLRAWLARLADQHVTLRTRWRWTGWDGPAVLFDTPDGPLRITPAVTILALGGASWARLGSDGRWAEGFSGQVSPFQPSNVGLRVDWSPHMAPFFGQPVKNIALTAGLFSSRGEAMITPKGLEGGGVYAIIPGVRAGHPVALNLFPDQTLTAVHDRWASLPAKESLPNRLRRMGLTGARAALMLEWHRPIPPNGGAVLVCGNVPHLGPLPMDQAISTAGGLHWDAMDGYMLKGRPGTFAAGEMLDWDAPTGGYLITGCLATGRAAALQAMTWLRDSRPAPGPVDW
jgi:uncharacterized flavoprotein (TIGR03862 family)